MNEDLKALIGDDSPNESSSGGVDISALFARINAIDDKLNIIIERIDRDIDLGNTNRDKIDITEAEGKIEEQKEYEEKDGEQ